MGLGCFAPGVCHLAVSAGAIVSTDLLTRDVLLVGATLVLPWWEGWG